jgi:hypothetical protein
MNNRPLFIKELQQTFGLMTGGKGIYEKGGIEKQFSDVKLWYFSNLSSGAKMLQLPCSPEHS